MATVVKDFKVKNGLIVEGTTATVNNFDVLTKKSDDQTYIVNLIGGTATSANEANKVVKRDASGNFAAGTITADLTGDVIGTVSDISNHDTADLAEGTNLYFTNQRALDATSAAYDAAGTAASQAGSVASDLTDHENATVAHGATGAVVGTTNTQTLTNKTIGDTLNFTGAGAMTINSDSHIVLTPAGGSYVKWGADILATQAYVDTAETSANSYTNTREGLITTAYQSYADAAEADAVTTANAYTDEKVADLVDSAPDLLNTLNELAAAIGNDDNFATTLTTSVGTKVSKDGDTMTGLLVLSADPSANLGAATKQYVDTAEADAVTTANAYTDGRETAITTAYQSYADTAEADAIASANSYTNGEITDALVTAQGYASDAQDNAQTFATNAINGLDTDDIEEGAAQYFTDVRAKTSAAQLLTGATKTNIVITGDQNGLTITAENGVADSNTDALVEGDTNLYFTNARAVTALEAVTPDFPAVEIANIAKQVAAEASVATASTNTAVSWAKASYRSAEFLVKIANGSHTEVSKVILTLDTSDNIAITEYAMVGTNGDLGSVSADVSGNDVRLRVATLNNDSTVAVVGTLLK